MSADERRVFVLGLVDGTIWTNFDYEESLVPIAFMPIAMGAFKDVPKDDLDQVGCLWADTTKDHPFPRGINGKPIFATVRVMHKDDWQVCCEAARLEFERRKEIPV